MFPPQQCGTATFDLGKTKELGFFKDIFVLKICPFDTTGQVSNVHFFFFFKIYTVGCTHSREYTVNHYKFVLARGVGQ